MQGLYLEALTSLLFICWSNEYEKQDRARFSEKKDAKKAVLYAEYDSE